MNEFIGTVFSFPTALFTFSLFVVVGYWTAVVFGAAELDMFDDDEGLDTDEMAGFVGRLLPGGVPVTVTLSSLIAFCWFFSLVGTVVLDRFELSTPLEIALALLVLAVAVVAAWLVTCLVVIPLRKALPNDSEAASHRDFVGRMCVIRTGRVDAGFGQAELTSPDGSSAVIQVRRPAEEASAEPLTAGSTALIFDYDAAGGFFWVMPYDAAMDPDHPLP